MKRICVFLGSSKGRGNGYIEAARSLGKELAVRGYELVYGGSSLGCMGELADAALETGGTVIGVVPRLLVDKEIAHTRLTELKTVDSMHERKALMAELSDAFIALPGGLGTLDEFFEMLTWSQLEFHYKPSGILDVAGYYDQLSAFLDNMVANDFLAREHREMVLFSNDAAGLLDKLKKYTPPSGEEWLEKKKQHMV